MGAQAVFINIKQKDLPVDAFTMHVVLDLQLFPLDINYLQITRDKTFYKPFQALHLACLGEELKDISACQLTQISPSPAATAVSGWS